MGLLLTFTYVSNRNTVWYRTVLLLLKKRIHKARDQAFSFIFLELVILQEGKSIFFRIPNKFNGRTYKDRRVKGTAGKITEERT